MTRIKITGSSDKACVEVSGHDEDVLALSDAAIDLLTREGYDPDMGARPVKRAIQHHVLNELSRRLLAGQVSREKPIIIDSFDDDAGLVFRN